MQNFSDTSAKIALERVSISLRLLELEYLLLNRPVLTNELERNKLAELDVSEYVYTSAGATAFVPPKENTCLFVQYDVLFEEIISNL
jgi:hypothetical protein